MAANRRRASDGKDLLKTTGVLAEMGWSSAISCLVVTRQLGLEQQQHDFLLGHERLCRRRISEERSDGRQQKFFPLIVPVRDENYSRGELLE
jgi:hypothetical protein